VAFEVEILHRRECVDRLQRRLARRLIFTSAYHDLRRCETISQLSRVDVLGLLEAPVELIMVPDVVKGEVLVDSRGCGSFQR
jgi:hypothetical protein